MYEKNSNSNEGKTSSVDEMLDKLQTLVEKMSKKSQPFDIDAINLFDRVYYGWLDKKLPIETWEQVAKYNYLRDIVNRLDHRVSLISPSMVVWLNPSLKNTWRHYDELREKSKVGQGK